MKHGALLLMLLGCLFSPMAHAGANMCQSDADCNDPFMPYCNYVTLTCQHTRSCTSDAECTDPSTPICDQDTNSCDALPVACQSDADCNNPAKPVCDTINMKCIAAPTGSLFGVISDRANGLAKVHPVQVHLLNAVTGSSIVSVANLADGSYEFTNISEGDYKLFFDANGAADAYLDELYFQVPCDGGSCDESAIGDLVEVNEGVNMLQATLGVGYTLSGKVMNELLEPFPEVFLQIFDATGTLIATVQSNNLGEWSKTRLISSDYYVRTVPATTPGYVPEIYDDISCKECDVLATGTPIAITNSDTSSINIVLEPYPEIVFKDGFESSPEP
jgi:hypothetical protein